MSSEIIIWEEKGSKDNAKAREIALAQEISIFIEDRNECN